MSVSEVQPTLKHPKIKNMIIQIVSLAILAATANAGLATSYAAGGLLSHGGAIYGAGLGHGGAIYGAGLGHGGALYGGGLAGHGAGHAAIAVAPVAIAKQTVVDYFAPANYEFKYGVEDPKTGDNKKQSEVRHGDSVKGEYSLAEPDGTIRIVKYTADKHNGFNAIVSRIGHAVHPQLYATKASIALPIALHDGGLAGHGGLGGKY